MANNTVSNTEPVQQPYTPPEILKLGEVAALTRGNGAIYTDSLGNTSTQYGKVN